MPDSDLDSNRLRDLIARMRAGDQQAADRLLRSILGRFQKLARRMLREFPAVRGHEQTEDVVNLALVRFLRALKKVTPETTRDFYNLATEQIRRQLLDLARRYRRGRPLPLQLSDDSGAGGDHPPDAAPSPVELDRWEQFHQAVADLPAEQREVIGLTFYHGWTQARIAELFAVDEKTVRRRWKAACRALNEALGGQLPGM